MLEGAPVSIAGFVERHPIWKIDTYERVNHYLYLRCESLWRDVTRRKIAIIALLVTIRGNATSTHYRNGILQAVRSLSMVPHISSTKILATSLVSVNLPTEGYLH